MINYAEVVWRSPEDKQRKWGNNIKAMAMAFVIGEDVVFTDVVDANFGNISLSIPLSFLFFQGKRILFFCALQ
jgi:hypothetical protein